MSDQGAQFYIEDVVEGESGRVTVIGRCGAASIRVGEAFTQSFREAIGIPVADELGVPRGRIEEQPVALLVVEIRAYGRLLDEIGQGMTGLLALIGTGAAKATPGRILGGLVSKTEATRLGLRLEQKIIQPSVSTAP